MTRTTKLALFVLGALSMSLPGLFTAGVGWAFVGFLMVGYLTLIVATVTNGSSLPGTALKLLVASNISFWLGYGFWLIRLRVVGPSPRAGTEAFAGPVAVWLVLLITFIIYELIIFIRGFSANRERKTAAIGLVASVVQVLVTLRTAYGLVQGV